jgi:TrmH family RNA methyltransferase
MRDSAPVEINSLQNRWVKEIRKAIRKGGPTDSGLLVAEGSHLLEEALRSGLAVRALFATREWAAQNASLSTDASLVPAALMQEMTSLETPPGVIALVEPPPPLQDLAALAGQLWLVLDAVQDPGNAGAILRSAEAFGVAAILSLRGSVDLFSPKVLRASAGSAFRVPLLRHAEWRDLALPKNAPLYAATPTGGHDPREVNWRAGAGLIIGNEGRGISPDLAARAQAVSIPTSHVESLNAAIAASILIYEAARERGLPA